MTGWDAVAREWERVGTELAGAFEDWVERVLYTDAEWVAITWPTLERSWLKAFAAWLKGTP